jgi:hypothetical protein
MESYSFRGCSQKPGNKPDVISKARKEIEKSNNRKQYNAEFKAKVALE